MKTYNLLFILLLLISFSCHSQNYSEREKTFISLFNNFISYLNTKEDITDSVHLKYIVQNHLFIDSKGELSNEKTNILKKQLKTFYNFLHKENLAENISVIPIRFADDKNIYKDLSTFQKENTLLYFDKRSPKKILGYILFMPPVEKVISVPRIWSWTLMYQYGKYMFRSVTGEEGYEYIFAK